MARFRPLSRRSGAARRDSGASEAGSSSGVGSVRAARLGPRLPTINLDQSFRRFWGSYGSSVTYLKLKEVHLAILAQLCKGTLSLSTS
jgi:hypothetical protein